MLQYSTQSELDRDLFEMALVEAATSKTPVEIGLLSYPAELIEVWLEEGRMRTAVNAKIGTAHKDQKKQQKITGQTWTCDELGRVCEGPVELMLGLDVAAVNHDGTEPTADKVIDGIRFDVKGAGAERDCTFSLPVWTVKKDRYDALVLVQYLEPGQCRVWACAVADEALGFPRPGTRGRPAYFLIDCKR